MTKRRRSLLAPLLAAAFLAPRASAHDGSGGAAIREILARVEFQQDPNSPVLFAWDDARKERIRAVLAETLDRMPLDVAGLPAILGIKIANTAEACSLVRCSQSAGWSGQDGHMLIAGWTLVLDDQQSGYLAQSVVHELAHAWQESRPDLTRGFAAEGFDARARAWADVKAESARHIDRVVQTCPADCDTVIVRELELSSAREAAEYERLKFPRRTWVEAMLRQAEPGGSGRDQHPMDNLLEYHAALVEMLWADPALAAEYYSAGEIESVKLNAFGGRAGSRALAGLRARLDRATEEASRVVLPQL